MAVLKAWDIVQTSSLGSKINFPLMREKQRKVLSRLKEHAEQVAWAQQSVNNFIEGNIQLLAKRNDITDTMNRITSRFQQMQQYELHQDKLEMSTLLTFAEWTVSPNAYSVHHLMDRLHLTMFGSDDKANKSGSNMLEMLALMFICCNTENLASTTYLMGRSMPSIEIDAIRDEYLSLEQSLWQHLQRSQNNRNTEQQMRKIADTHRKFINENMNSTWSLGKYELLNHYEWSILERDLQQKNNVEFARSQELDDLMDNILRNDRTFSMGRIFQDTELIMVKQTMYYRAMMASKEERCLNQQSTQQFIYSLYTDIALTELKGYTMMEFSWMMLRVYGKGNFTQEAELMRNDYEKRTEKTVRLLREVMQRAERIVWRCDPEQYVKGKTYEEVTRLIQGYIENEVDMNYNRECWKTCDDYERTKNEGCFKDKFCARQERCSGHIHNCRYVDSDMTICPSARDSVRRYEFIEYENGVTLGKASNCPRGKTAVDSWWRYLFWHCTYCFCLCDDQYSTKTDRYFNLRETLSNINDNKVVTGLRFTKKNRVFHLQIQEGALLPRGMINESTLEWKPVDNYTLNEKGVHNNRDYYTLTYGARSIDLDDIHTEDNTFVVTGVRFRVVGAHLNLEARLSEFNFETGQLVNPKENSFWKSNDNTDVSGDRRAKIELKDPDVPIRTIAKSVPDSRHNQYLEFSASSFNKDASQSTVPFIDIQDVVSKPSVPLAGIGIYHKGRPGFGGFLAPKLMTYDFAPHIHTPQFFKSSIKKYIFTDNIEKSFQNKTIEVETTIHTELFYSLNKIRSNLYDQKICRWPCLEILLFTIILISKPENSLSIDVETIVAASGAVKDIIGIIKYVKETISESWSFVENNNQESNNNLPQILTRFTKVGNDISYIENKHYSESVNNFINLQLVAKHNDIINTINTITSRFKEMQEYAVHLENIESSTLISFAEWTASPNGFSVYHLMDRLHLTMFGSDDKANRPGSNIFDMLISSYGISEKCFNQQSTQQFIYSLYTDIALTELKAYTMLEFSWIILRAYGKGNFTQEAEIMRKSYEKRLEKTVHHLHEVMDRADRMVWRCDPERYVEGETYEQVTRLLQAYIENEVDMSSNRDCMQSCSAYGRTKNEGCYMDQFCAKQERCSGQIHDCFYASGYITACPSALDSLRRYEYVQYDKVTLGNNFNCQRGETEANSWMRYVFWECSYCICFCDDQNSIKTDRYFNLRETLSNIDDNKVVTGLRFTKVNRVFHLQIQEGQLLPRGMINESTLAWKRVDNYTLFERGVLPNQDYFTLTYDARSIDLDNIETYDENYVVTGVRFQLLHSHLNLQARLSKVDFETGQLLNPQENSYWKVNDISEFKRNEIVLHDLDIPTHSTGKSDPDSSNNQYLKFSFSSLKKDVSQTNIPFIDIQDVVSKPPVPLDGIGIYHKGRQGYGGFLAPKLITYDFAPHIHTATKENKFRIIFFYTNLLTLRFLAFTSTVIDENMLKNNMRFLKPHFGFILLILTFTPETISISILQLVGTISASKDVISHSVNNNFINLQLLTKVNDFTNTSHNVAQRFREFQQFLVHDNNLDPTTLLTFAEWTVATNGFAVQHLMDNWHRKIFDQNDQESNKLYSNLFEFLVSSYKKEEKCLNQQSSQQFIYSLYTNIALTELKAYTLLELSWLILSVYNKGNFSHDAEIIRKNYEKRSEQTERQLYKLMQKADRMVWRCDPERYIEGETYEQVTRLLQAYIENEVDMSSSRDCMQSCSAYGRTSNVGCYMDQFCAKQERCSGQIHDCYYTSGYITACPSAFESLRRYEYIKYNDQTIGKETHCQRGESEANSWMRYLVWECSYCICFCDDQNSIKTNRYFNLRETLSNIDDNKVVTGLRFTKVNRVFHLQIQEGQLMPRGIINESTLNWKPVDNYTIYERGVLQNQDYFTLTYDTRSIDLDNIETYDENYVITGVRFQVVGAHLNLQARLSKFNYASGQLVNPKEISYWKINDISEFRRNEIVLSDRDVPTRSTDKSEPNFGSNQYLKFSVSSLEKDVSQTNIPFIDIQDVVSKPPVPLAGIGIYYKGRQGYGGFIAPKIITYDFSPRLQTTQ
ncbi:hypothetical protein CVS40_5407 [Lucilia cuprina]|nr:hypothetical protein CVS40_5407 [Lucilia cuprina]